MPTQHEKEWYRKFQEGTFLIRGWQSRKQEILKAVPARQKEEVDKLLDTLGKKIGREWAKERTERCIDTPKLQQWGDQLRRSRKKGSDTLLAEIHRIDAEVDDMLT